MAASADLLIDLNDDAFSPLSLSPLLPTLTPRRSLACQRHFHAGLLHAHGFHHEEAHRSFQLAIQEDSRCAIAYWGIAMALGPNYNHTFELFGEGELDEVLRKITEAVDQAMKLAREGEVDEIEAALIQAMAQRLPTRLQGELGQQSSLPSSVSDAADYRAWNERYTAAMRDVYKRFYRDGSAKSSVATPSPSWNLTLAHLFAESLMVETPWRLWDLQTGAPATGSHVLEIRDVLERAMRTHDGGDRHPGLLHLYVHAMEQSAEPEVALAAGDVLRDGILPNSGHLLHMPSHLDLLVGQYARAVEANRRGIEADERYRRGLKEKNRNGLGFYAVYVLHNITSLIYAAMLAGNYATSIDYTRRLEDVMMSEDMQGLDHFVEPMWATRVMVWVRFGRWHELLEFELRSVVGGGGDGDKSTGVRYPISTALGYYGRGIALAALGRVDEAAEQRELYVDALANVPADRLMFPNKASDVLPIGTAMLDGEIAYRRGTYDAAWRHLECAVERYDALVYGEPWSWMQPTRHTLGALRLEQGDVEQALEVFAADLGEAAVPGGKSRLARPFQHPNNIWALRGYRECLMRLGRDGEVTGPGGVDERIERAQRGADVEIKVGCMCARGKVEVETRP